MTKRTGYAFLWAGVALGALGSGIAMPVAAYAQSAPEGDISFDVAPRPLAQAVIEFSRQAGVQLVLDATVAEGVTGRAVNGRMSVDQAVTQLLSGTGLTWRRVNDRTITIERLAADGGERVLGAVRVQGAQGGGLAGSTPANGINGSRDVTATENTGSYTSNALTVGSKVAATIKDTPMAVSVITNQQIQDRNVTDLNSAMRDAPGVTTLNSGNDFTYYSRGFKITQIQLDGGAPLALNGGLGVYKPIIDMSLYDHVELVRGATGTFNAYGDPGGVINLVRKRPLDHSQMLLELQGGSWNWTRASADITGPLGFGGKLRGRLIATHQGNDYFYKISHLDRNVVSGTLEYDLTKTTLVSAGVNYQTQSGSAWSAGLPRFYDGTSLGLPRSTALTLPDGYNRAWNFEYYGQIEQRIGSRWKLTLKATRSNQHQDELNGDAYARAGIDLVTHEGAAVSANQILLRRYKQTSLEATIDGSVRFLGQDQKFILGANYSMGDAAGTATFQIKPGVAFVNKNVGDVFIDVFDYNPYDWIINREGYYQNYGTDYGDTRSINVYFSADISPLRGLHFSTSLRYSDYRSRVLSWTICVAGSYYYNSGACSVLGAKYYNTAGSAGGGGSFSWPPSISARYDINGQLTAYATYADIYKDRSQYLDANKKPLPPTTGMNFEGGLKWLSDDKKLNVNLSVYYTKQRDITQNRICDPTTICTNPGNIPGVLNTLEFCCYVTDPKSFYKSYGLDLEFTGEVSRGWQVAASYTFNRNEQVAPGLRDFDGSTVALQSQAPKHLAKIWSTYEFGPESRLKGLRVGLGANGQSMTFVSTARCTQYFTLPNGQPFFCLSSVPVHFSDPGHVVVDASIGYKINNSLRVDAEFENLLDKTYYATIGDITGANWYGAPRNFKVTLRGKF